MTRWNGNYITGIEKLDKEHQQLFQIVDQVLNKLQERGDEADYRIFFVRETLTHITNYFERHAKAEEGYMCRIGYTRYALYRMLHDKFYNTQLKKYQDIVKHSECSKEEIQDFIGSGIGWLLERITTADIAIIGKGTLAVLTGSSDFEARLEEEINTLLTVSLNIAVNARIINKSCQGESLGKTIHRKMVYGLDLREITIVSDIESSFLFHVVKTTYGTEVKNETDLILSSLQLFATNFWRPMGQHFAGSNTMMIMKLNSFIIAGLLPEELRGFKLTHSLFFASDMGKFSIVVNYRKFQKYDRVAVPSHRESERGAIATVRIGYQFYLKKDTMTRPLLTDAAQKQHEWKHRPHPPANT